MKAALGLVRARPAALAPGARLGAGRAADRLIALIVQRVVRQVALVDPPPQILVGPVGERVVLPQAARSSRSISSVFARVGPCSRRMPVIQPSAPASEPSSAATFATEQQCSGPLHGSLGELASCTSIFTPKRSSNARHVCMSRGTARRCRSSRSSRRCRERRGHLFVESQQLVDQHRLLLLEGAQQALPARRGARLAQRVREAQRRIEVRVMFISIPRTRPRRESLRTARCGSSR